MPIVTSQAVGYRGGQRLGPYRLIDTLGEGGMGIVYSAQREDGPLVALKVARSASRAYVAAVAREVRALGMLRHAGIVRMIDHDLSGAQPWFAMERVSGGSLGALTRRLWQRDLSWRPRSARTSDVLSVAAHSEPPTSADLSPRSDRSRISGRALAEIARTFRELCEVVAYVHESGVIHGDLKPSNILLAHKRPILIDFGQCGFCADAHVALRSGGTVEYCSPEQAAGNSATARSDLYALGCIFYELVTGSCPFVGQRDSVLAQHIGAAPLAPTKLVRNLPGPSEQALLALLSKTPEHRPPALKALLESLP
jgi:serine/threonine-protein kinase